MKTRRFCNILLICFLWLQADKQPLLYAEEKKPEIRFIAMGALRLGTVPEERYDKIIPLIRRKNADFLLLVGGGIDMETGKPPAGLWKKVDSFTERLGIPVYCTYGPALRGDIPASKEQTELYDREFLRRFPAKYFSFEYENNLFIFLDTSDPGLYKKNAAFNDKTSQYIFLKNAFSGSNRHRNIFIAATHSRWKETNSGWKDAVHPLIKGKNAFVFGDHAGRLTADRIEETTYVSLGFQPGKENILDCSFLHFLTVEAGPDGVSIYASAEDDIPLLENTPDNGPDYPVDPLFTLTSPDRETILEPERVIETIRIKPGARILDVGAGTGFWTFRFADALHGTGTVFATEIQPDLIKHIQGKAAEKNYKNVVPVLVAPGPADPFYTNRTFDIIFLCELLNDISYQEPLLKALHSCLERKTGRLYVINYNPDAEFHRVDFGDYKQIFRVFLKETPEFPALKRMNASIRGLLRSRGQAEISPGVKEQILSDFNAMLSDPALYREIIEYYSSQNPPARAFIVSDLCRTEQTGLVKWLISHLESESTSNLSPCRINDAKKKKIHLLNKILLSDIFGFEKTSFLSGEDVGIGYPEKNGITKRMKKLGYSFVREYRFLSQFYFLEFKR
ncbi:MAG: methyltransferase domain-containing protein [Candidatus Omnitrophota bacterium]|jgi:ubiquinone/menaquinone biosynthesis C-methylase UbiE